MQLNESTYETIFLLYIDKELSPKEGLEVEAFIAANPNYAIEMEALKATLLRPEQLQYPFKENLKQQALETSLEDLEEDWKDDSKATYTAILKEDMHSIPGLSTSFKNTLKKEAATKGIILKPFGFNQNKFTYAAIAACLLIFLGYQQFTKAPAAYSQVSNSIVANSKIEVLPNATAPLDETSISNASPKILLTNIEPLVKTKQVVLTKQLAITKLQASNFSKTQRTNILQQESIAMAETTSNNGSLNKQAVMKEIPSTYNNPITIIATSLPISSASIEAAPSEVEKVLTNYEIIDTEDPSRTIFIANFEIDGAAFRGITRRVSALLKRNKSEKEK